MVVIHGLVFPLLLLLPRGEFSFSCLLLLVRLPIVQETGNADGSVTMPNPIDCSALCIKSGQLLLQILLMEC